MKKYQNLVREFHLAAGQPVADKPTKLSTERLNLRLELIKEEARELEDAVFSNDRVETLDALCDLMYVVCGKAAEEGLSFFDQNEIDTASQKMINRMPKFQAVDVVIELISAKNTSAYDAHKVMYLATLFGFDERTFYHAFKAVHESNMSKFCKSESEAHETIRKYKSNGVEAYFTVNNGLYVIFRTSNNKVLKSVNYHPVDLRELSKNDFRRF